jgi:hypothetical protein
LLFLKYLRTACIRLLMALIFLSFRICSDVRWFPTSGSLDVISAIFRGISSAKNDTSFYALSLWNYLKLGGPIAFAKG